MRIFRIDRIRELELLIDTFQILNDFNVQDYLESVFKDQPVVQARLRFIPEAAHIALSNRSVWKSCQENPDGSVEVKLEAPDSYWMASLVLSFGSWVTVLDPPELSKIVQEWALASAAQYENDEEMQ